MQPKVPGIELINELQIGKAGIGGSEAYIYLPPYSTQGYLRGKMPPNQSSLTIAGSVPNPALFAAQTFAAELEKQKFAANINTSVKRSGADTNFQIMYTHYSPALDSIVYWFLKKSVNLYGEALLKTIAKEMNGLGSTEGGLTVLNNFWKDKGIEAGSLKMLDGSGLSPQNRLTASGLVKVMQYAKSRPWFNAFYTGLPEYNGLKMKSGTIGGAKSFTGYSGDYTFAIIINNYIGSSQALVAKMYKVLDVLK
jgi:D-alanyl-D-alanine carboxypeptidase/D-alanyl-D-alanine-endopeptidase (penicillin-binding protein 4)